MSAPFTGFGIYAQWDDVEILARTAYGENRGGGRAGMQSVINVIMNRAAQTDIEWWGVGVRGVCLKFEQFDCWMATDPNLKVIMNVSEADPSFAVALDLAQQAINGTLPDLTSGSTYYIACDDDSPPVWSQGKTPVAVIAGQQFYNNIE